MLISLQNSPNISSMRFGLTLQWNHRQSFLIRNGVEIFVAFVFSSGNDNIEPRAHRTWWKSTQEQAFMSSPKSRDKEIEISNITDQTAFPNKICSPAVRQLPKKRDYKTSNTPLWQYDQSTVSHIPIQLGNSSTKRTNFWWITLTKLSNVIIFRYQQWP
jgi:hypothetical protein